MYDEPIKLLVQRSVRKRTLQDLLEVKLTDEQYEKLRIFADRLSKEYDRDPFLEEYKTALQVITGTGIKVRRKNIRRFQVSRRRRLEDIITRRYNVPDRLLREFSDEVEVDFEEMGRL